MLVLLLVGTLCVTPFALGGHYKIRPPPPPSPQLANHHYGSHPPPQRSSYGHPYRNPPYPHYPPSMSKHYPRNPYFYKSAPREYHHRPPLPPAYQPKIVPNYVPSVHALPAIPPGPPVQQVSLPLPQPSQTHYNLWNNYDSFRAPVIRETFNQPQAAAYISPSPLTVKDDDKGPIHTIPAPNLGGGPDGSRLISSHVHQSPLSHQQHKTQDPESDLVAVLRHGITRVNVPHSPNPQMAEDPSIHSYGKDTPLHFAPDPDPSTPTLKVPATNDPFSIPSNGQVPLDIYLQQEADHQAAAPTESSNALTAQDLFNLLNYQPGSASQLQSFPEYNSESLLQESFPSTQFTPQFQTFNYDERTQQGAYGSNSFPTASMSLELSNSDIVGTENLLEDLKTLQDNDLEGSEKDEVFHKIVDPDNEVEPKRNEPKKKSLDKKEQGLGKNDIAKPTKRPIGSDITQPAPKFEIRVSDINEEEKSKPLPDKPVPCPPDTSCVLPVQTQSVPPTETFNSPPSDDGVQLQKSIQIYSTSYTTSVNDGHHQSYESPVHKTDVKKGRGIAIAEITEDNINPQEESADPNLAFGARIRPKRF